MMSRRDDKATAVWNAAGSLIQAHELLMRIDAAIAAYDENAISDQTALSLIRTIVKDYANA